VTLLDLLGWTSSALVVWSLMQARVLRFRVLNLAGAAIATGVNALVGLWPFVAMNGAIAVIDVYWLVRLLRERHDVQAYDVLEVGVGDAFLEHLLRVHRDDLRASHPHFVAPGPAGGPDAACTAFLVLRADEVVGVVVVRDVGQGVGQVELDYVTSRFRDFTPGEFVYRRSGIFARHGFTRLRLVEDVAASRDYYARVGFTRAPGGWEREVEPAA